MMFNSNNNKEKYVNKDISLMKNVLIIYKTLLFWLERVDYLNRENFKLLDKLLYISRKEGKLSKNGLRNKKYVHTTLNTNFRKK